MTADTNVCLPGRKKGRSLVTNLWNIMENGHFVECMEYRFVTYINWKLVLLFVCNLFDSPHYSFHLIMSVHLWTNHHLFIPQEPVSVALSVINLAVQFHGWVSFFVLVNYKLPFRPNKQTYYEYTGLCNIYAILAKNAWFRSAVFHSRWVFSVFSFPLSSPVNIISFVLICLGFIVYILSRLWV